MWALPTEVNRPVSCWTSEDDVLNSRLGSLDQINATPLEVKGPISDPPWLAEDSESVSTNVETNGAELMEGLAPPMTGVDQQCTTIELVKHNGKYAVVLDGVQMPDAFDPDHSADNGVPRFWLPRFRDVVSSPLKGSEQGERTAGPLCIGVRLEEAEVAPTRVTVSVRQKIIDYGVVLINPYDKDLSTTEVHNEDITPYSVADHGVGYTMLPYPATITRQPIITIIDMDERRRWEFAARRWQWNRTLKVVTSIASLIMIATTPEVAVPSLAGAGLIKLIKALGQSYNSINPAKAMWKTLLLQSSPGIRHMVEAITATADITWFGYEAAKQPPTEITGYDFSISQFSAALKYIAETRSDGTSESRPRGLSPIEMSRQGRNREAALLYWLVYGNESVLDDPNLESFKKDNESNDGSWTGSIDWWPSWLRWNSKTLTGNLLDTRGIDPYMASQSRIEYVVRITVEERDGTVSKFDFEPLRANAIDAGYILTNVEGDLKEMRAVVTKVKQKLEDLRTYGFSWIHQTLYVADGSTGSYWMPGIRNWFSSANDAERRRRWKELQTARQGGSIASMPPLIFKPEEFVKRLLLLLYGPTQDEIIGFDDDGVAKLEDADARIKRRREEAEPNPYTWFGVTQNSGVPNELFNKWMADLETLYRKTLGLPNRTPEDPLFLDHTKTFAFWRYVDAYVPVLGLPDGFGLSAFVVPKLDGNARRRPANLVRRMPQIGVVATARLSIFGTTPILKVKHVPADPLSERRLAKAAVAAAQKCWARTTLVYRRLHWAVESSNFYGAPNSFHFLQCYNPLNSEDARAAFEQLPILYPAESSANVLGLVAAQPENVTAEEMTADQFPRPVDTWARNAAAGTRRIGDAADLQAFKLVSSRESLLALQAYAAIVAYKAVKHSATLQRQDLVQSSAQDANATAVVVAKVIDSLYGTNTKSTMLVSRDDIFFSCVPHATYARAVLLQLDGWRAAQRVALAKNASSTAQFYVTWPVTLRHRASAFAHALRTIAKSAVSPLKIPVIALQCLWYTGNPTVDRLLATEDVARSGMELQIREAAASFRRVQRIVANTPEKSQTTASLAALQVAIACRPVVLVAWMEGHRERVARALQASTVSVQRVKPMAIVGNRPALRMRCAGLRLDSTFAMRNEQVLRESVDTLLNRMTLLNIDSAARYAVPSGSLPYSATPLDLSNASALEDVVVWKHHVSEALQRQNIVAGTSSARGFTEWFKVDAIKVTNDGISHHPQLIELWSNRATIFMVENPSLDQEPLVGTLPVTINEVLDGMKRSMEVDRRRSLTWTLTQRTRALMWNVDRMIQLMLLIEATVSDPLQPMVINTLQFDGKSRQAMCVAAAVAHAAIRTVYPTKAQFTVAVSESDVADTRKLIGHVDGIVGDEEQPVPLSELCMVLTTLCP